MPGYRFSRQEDVPALAGLINRAFVAESPYVEGERINAEGVRELLGRGKFLVIEEAGIIVACVYVEPRAASAHIGLVSVDPSRQGAGVGSRLMVAAEGYCRSAGFHEMELRFINHRVELQRFYCKLGFSPTGVNDFPGNIRVKVPFHFVQMSKTLL